MNNGRQLLMERHSYTEPADLYLVTPRRTWKKDGNTRVYLPASTITQLTHENQHILDRLAKPTVESRWVKTTDGGQMLYWIIQPPHFDPTKKYPTLLFCEGGPQSPVSQLIATVYLASDRNGWRK